MNSEFRKFKALIVACENNMVNKLKRILKDNFPEIEFSLIDKCNDEACREIHFLNPDVVFVDMEMGKDGACRILENLYKNFNFIVISSCEKYAVTAISYGVKGYLLKPLKFGEVLTSINRIKELNKTTEEHVNGKPAEKVIDIVNANMIALPSMGKVDLIDMDEIVFLKANGRYTDVLLVNGVSKIACKNLGEFEKLLNPELFFRTHHSFIVNIRQIRNINKSGGNYLELKVGNTFIPIAKRRLDVFNKYLKLK